MVCNFSPAGNVPGQPVNKFGAVTCKDCDEVWQACLDDENDGLCGRGE